MNSRARLSALRIAVSAALLATAAFAVPAHAADQAAINRAFVDGNGGVRVNVDYTCAGNPAEGVKITRMRVIFSRGLVVRAGVALTRALGGSGLSSVTGVAIGRETVAVTCDDRRHNVDVLMRKDGGKRSDESDRPARMPKGVCV